MLWACDVRAANSARARRSRVSWAARCRCAARTGRSARWACPRAPASYRRTWRSRVGERRCVSAATCATLASGPRSPLWRSTRASSILRSSPTPVLALLSPSLRIFYHRELVALLVARICRSTVRLFEMRVVEIYCTYTVHIRISVEAAVSLKYS